MTRDFSTNCTHNSIVQNPGKGFGGDGTRGGGPTRRRIFRFASEAALP